MYSSFISRLGPEGAESVEIGDLPWGFEQWLRDWGYFPLDELDRTQRYELLPALNQVRRFLLECCGNSLAHRPELEAHAREIGEIAYYPSQHPTR